MGGGGESVIVTANRTWNIRFNAYTNQRSFEKSSTLLSQTSSNTIDSTVCAEGKKKKKWENNKNRPRG